MVLLKKSNEIIRRSGRRTGSPPIVGGWRVEVAVGTAPPLSLLGRRSLRRWNSRGAG
jgi:hypothetical protein